MKTSSVIAVIIAIIVVGGAVWYFGVRSAAQTGQAPVADLTTNPAQPGGASDAGAAPAAGQTVTVHYDGASFSPQTVTIHAGDTVTWVADSGQMWVASAPHPVHTAYDGTTEQVHCAAGYGGPKPFDECGGGSTFSFTFDKTGSWKYHNHFNSSAFGTVVVQ